MNFLRISRFIGLMLCVQCVCPLQAQRVKISMDSAHATTYLTTIIPGTRTGVQSWIAGSWIAGVSSEVPIYLELYKEKGNNSGIRLRYKKNTVVLAAGDSVQIGKDRLVFQEQLDDTAAYRLMLVLAGDSAANYTLYSGYAFLPRYGKWKFLGTIRQTGFTRALHWPSTFYSFPKKDTTRPIIKDQWVQKVNGNWERLDRSKMQPPVVNLVSHVDSLAGVKRDERLIQDALVQKHIPDMQNERGVYYSIARIGTGRQVTITDTVIVFYRGYLFSDSTVFDQTDKEPRRFPLQRLIPGWQIGLPLLREGGKITLVIPAHLAYGIRTRSPKIPPASILIFEVEVVESISVK